MKLRYATLCSGIEAPSVAWEHLGWKPVFFSEIANFPSAILAQRWPEVPNLGDFTVIDGGVWRGKVDVLWASTPCQDFSLAGRRAGVEGARGGLTIKAVELIDAINPHFLCFENVKGLLSDRANAFGHFLGLLVGEDRALEPPGGRWTHAGHVHGPRRSVAWRLMDAQHGGVAQRRERVFLVGCPRGGASPQQILFEHGGVRRNIASSCAEGSVVAALTACGVGTCGADDNQAQAGHLIADQIGVRKLLPVECERLMGFPDEHTRISWRGKPPERCPDAGRYKALGNSIAVPDVRWIGGRIQQQVGMASDRRAAGRTVS